MAIKDSKKSKNERSGKYVRLRQFVLVTTILLMTLSMFHTNAQRSDVKHSFALGDSVFLLDNKPFQIISGEMHYPRIPREAWRARMKMAKAMGLNTISTYVFWNLQEPQKDSFDFSGNNDIAAFVKTAQQEGLWVILRPSPYVCAEWEFGGYPYWLQNEKGLVVRSKEAQYMKEYEKYINQVGKQLAPLQINHGGNIIMVQIENEYGSYGSDKDYLRLNEKMFKEAGFDGLLYTCDPAPDVAKGYLPGLLPGVNGTDNPQKVKKIVQKYHNGKGPYIIAEWYPAWFDWWGTKHHRVPAATYAGRLDSVLSAGLSINMYMFHGGTTRGFMNGANDKDVTPYEPQTSSYDYDAPLDEAGNPTKKFMVFRGVIEKHLPIGEQLPAVPEAKGEMEINNIRWDHTTSLVNELPEPVLSENPLTFEKLKQAYGFVLYRHILKGGQRGVLRIDQLRDYAIIMINGRKVGIRDRRFRQDSMQIEFPEGNDTLDILVENLGRINFGPNLLKNEKGITNQVLFRGKPLRKWSQYCFPFDMHQYLINNEAKNSIIGNGPVLKQGTFNLTELKDTYLDMQNWGKGVVWVNGHNLGRYWYVGPQQTIYLPAEWLKMGINTIEVLELLKPNQHELKGITNPIIDKLQKQQ